MSTLNHSTVLPERLIARLNPGDRSVAPFAVIELDEDHRTYLTVGTTAEADALIAAAVEAKGLLLHGAGGEA